MTADGKVEIQCEPCASGIRPVVVSAVEAVEVARSTHGRRALWVALSGGIATVAVLSIAGADTVAPVSEMAASTIETVEDVLSGAPDIDDDSLSAATYGERPAPPLPPMPERDGEPLDEWLPILRDWVHPVPSSPEVIVTKGSRVFGAFRSATENDCGGGHCGVDLMGETGQPLVAVAWGTVVKVQHDNVGRAGKYVRIEHPDFVHTSYMHLDRVAPGLTVGTEVDAGTVIGTLGQTGRAAMPHLHFSLEIARDHAGEDLEFIDPNPFLARSTVLELGEIKPLEQPLEPDADARP